MTETISARDANHHFSRLLREVEAGKEFVVTRNGVPVARIVPEVHVAELLPDGTRRLTEAQQAALEQTLERLRNPGWGPRSSECLAKNCTMKRAHGWPG